jgi:CheY-like chemotaxis protein
MIPKKRILLVGEKEDRLAIYRFLLEMNHFAVTSADTASHAAELLHTQPFDLILCELPLAGCQELIECCREIDSYMTSIVLVNKCKLPDGFNANALIFAREYSAAYLLDRVKLFTIRKRGPRPARIPPSGAPAAADADRRLA